MSEHTIHTHFPGRLIFIGFGSIGQGVLPLILRHVGGLTPDRITIVTADDAGRDEANKYGIKFLNHPLTRENYRHVLEPLVGRGDFVLNLSVDVVAASRSSSSATRRARSTSTPAPNRGRAATRTRTFPRAGARTTRCGKKSSSCARAGATARPPSSRTARTPASCRTS